MLENKMTYDSDVPVKERLIVALDVADLDALDRLLERLEGKPAFYKVGLELFIAEGARAVERVKATGAKVFLDLKLHDIPETVARAVRTAVDSGVDLMTLHAPGGSTMISRAVQAAAQGHGQQGGATGVQSKILAVTALTSLTAEDLAADGVQGSVEDVVARRAPKRPGRGRAWACLLAPGSRPVENLTGGFPRRAHPHVGRSRDSACWGRAW